MSTIKLTLYNPHSKQLDFHNSKARFRVCALGRQSGKSTMAMNELVLRAWNNPGTYYWFISPIFSQAKDQYRKAIQFLPHQVVQKKSETELRVDLINGSSIEYKSGEVLDRLRGATLDGVIIDEVRDQHAELWPMVIRPMLATTNGWAAFISTPNGFCPFYDLFNMSQTHSDWASIQAPTSCNPCVPRGELEAAKAICSEDEYAQEYLAEFREIGVGKAYKNHGTWNQANQNPFATPGEPWSPYLPILVGLDFNVGLMCWEILQNRGNQFYFGDEIALANTDSEECAKVLASRVKNHKPGLILVGDSSGNARKTSAVGKTDYTIIKSVLQAHDIKFENRTPAENPFVKDRINCVNGLLKAADGSVNLWYHPVKMKYLKRDFERVKWKQGADGAILDKSDPLATHASDAGGYPLCVYSDLMRSKPGVMRVIQR